MNGNGCAGGTDETVVDRYRADLMRAARSRPGEVKWRIGAFRQENAIGVITNLVNCAVWVGSVDAEGDIARWKSTIVRWIVERYSGGLICRIHRRVKLRAGNNLTLETG